MTTYDKAYPHLRRAADLEPENPQVWVDLLSLFERDTLIDQAIEAHRKIQELVGERELVQDESGLYVLEGEGKIFPYYQAMSREIGEKGGCNVKDGGETSFTLGSSLYITGCAPGALGPL